ncbi:MAG: 5-histidylcysteine sulfoxide synthase [Arcobacteraceae bacterium]|nr:5-histidylcysteine sulfoxide synthase [Arcobacteraceae bacterium]
MIKESITANISLYGDDIKAKKEEIKNYFLKTYDLFEKMFDVFVDDSVYYVQPEPLRHKLIFYFGHTSTFYINKLIVGRYIKDRINPKFESIFAIGVDEMSWDDLNNSNYEWPSAQEVRLYRQKVKDVVLDYIDNCEFTLPISWDSPMWVVLMGIEHERIHVETSSVLHRQLDIKYIKQTDFLKELIEYSQAPKNELLRVCGGVINLGRSKTSDFYGWDNEYGKYSENVADFKASKYLVSNGEFMEFVEDGGYEIDEYWSDEGLRWRNYKQAKYPTFWIKNGDKYLYRTLTQIVEMPESYPVDVNYLEAEAFCNYLSKKTTKIITLPSEAQWHRLAEFVGLEYLKDYSKEGIANINLEVSASSVSVDKFAHGDFYDVIGNVWQWTTSPIEGFDGFEVHPLYDDFSVPTFDTRHNIIKGGSWVSTGNEALLCSRYAFRRHFFQHAGFRYVEVDTISKNTFGLENSGFILEDQKFYDTLFDKLARNIDLSQLENILNIGCYYGGLVFDIHKANKNIHITGIDFTARNIMIADQNLKAFDYENIEFWQGDSCNLKKHFSGYDLIIVTNPFEEIYEFETMVNELISRLNPSGKIVFAFRTDFDVEMVKDLLKNKKIESYVWQILTK